MDGKTKQGREEAVRLKTLAEQKYNSSSLNSAAKYAKKAHRLCPKLDGVSEMLTAFQILQVGSKCSATDSGSAGDGGGEGATPEWYKILQVEPFSHLNTIKKQYKSLALILHPDKNPFAASEEAFKLVGEAFRVLSDKVRRKEYDMKLRIAMQSQATEGGVGGLEMDAEKFWSSCSACRLLHQFERKYLGHNLMCPSCKKSFNAVEVSENVSDGEQDKVGARSSARIRAKGAQRSGVASLKRKISSVGKVSKRSRLNPVTNDVDSNNESSVGGGVFERLRSKRVDELRISDKKGGKLGRDEVLENSKSKRAKIEEETMTLAEIKMLVKRKVHAEKTKLSSKEKCSENEKGAEKVNEKKERRSASKGGHMENERCKALKGGNSKIENHRRALKSMDSVKMAVEDSDFYDFDKDRVERSLRKGQIWAIYDDDDGMPRHYGLIDEVDSVSPFEVKMSWLDLQSNRDKALVCSEKMGIHVSCGRFKVARKTSMNSVNIFSHVVDAERVAREVYCIYPKKGSVWAMYNENTLGNEGKNPRSRDKRSYDIVVLLTSYSEIHGLSMAYLEKVDGFKTVFKRREIGCHAVRWLVKDNVQLFSHQIPAKTLSGEGASDLLKDCWELDPASLPAELLSIGWHK